MPSAAQLLKSYPTPGLWQNISGIACCKITCASIGRMIFSRMIEARVPTCLVIGLTTARSVPHASPNTFRKIASTVPHPPAMHCSPDSTVRPASLSQTGHCSDAPLPRSRTRYICALAKSRRHDRASCDRLLCAHRGSMGSFVLSIGSYGIRRRHNLLEP